MLTDLKLNELVRLGRALTSIDVAHARRLALDETGFLHRVTVGGPEDYILVPNDPTLASIRMAVAQTMPG
jgi:hypothetical protein